jgi:uncharacterized protein with GYD domain
VPALTRVVGDHAASEAFPTRAVANAYSRRVATYAMLTTLGPGGWETLREQPDRIHAVRREVEAMGLRVVAQYALLGQYDFLNIIEAPDERVMARAAVMLAARGTMRTTTMQAIPVDDLVEILAQ